MTSSKSDIEDHHCQPSLFHLLDLQTMKRDPFDLPDPGPFVQPALYPSRNPKGLPVRRAAEGGGKENEASSGDDKSLRVIPEKNHSEPGSKEARKVLLSQLHVLPDHLPTFVPRGRGHFRDSAKDQPGGGQGGPAEELRKVRRSDLQADVGRVVHTLDSRDRDPAIELRGFMHDRCPPGILSRSVPALLQEMDEPAPDPFETINQKPGFTGPGEPV